MKQIVISTQEKQTRIAVLEQGTLAELYFESAQNEAVAGNIYHGRVVNIVASMQAAFVDIGTDKHAFLYIDEALPPSWQNERGKKEKPGIQELVQNGQEIFVQVVKEAYGTKATRVSTEISIPGRALVYLPSGEQISISKKIRKTIERNRLEEIAREQLTGSEGVILRTAAEGMEREQLLAELQYLRKIWLEATNKVRDQKPPVLVHQATDSISWTIRELFSEQVDELIVDSSTLFARIQSMVQALFPSLRKRIKAYSGKQSLFESLRIEDQIDKLLTRYVPLANGGSIVIDRTEAMTVIDVNTGKYTGKSMQQLEQTVTQTNLEAAREIARQLRLRDIGGIIIIDFIDMKASSNQDKVLERLQMELSKDRTSTFVLGMTQLGLVELTRKRVRASVPELLTRSCPTCDERGRILNQEEVLLRMKREIRALIQNQEAEAVIVELHPEFAPYRNDLTDWAQAIGTQIHLHFQPEVHPGEYFLRFVGSLEDARRLSI
ncbi:Rne/Rng family ribonuclease [Brevibacillus sp. SYSU BS000544]|uniref:Rne/Rng family ribonuclease n=1 Tax=Brevibacillus sp. SYSU BS000544 TaxID=3416443 RepID=UPI003CE44AF4